MRDKCDKPKKGWARQKLKDFNNIMTIAVGCTTSQVIIVFCLEEHTPTPYQGPENYRGSIFLGFRFRGGSAGFGQGGSESSSQTRSRENTGPRPKRNGN